jgi:hypothetical protein
MTETYTVALGLEIRSRAIATLLFASPTVSGTPARFKRFGSLTQPSGKNSRASISDTALPWASAANTPT